MLLNHIVTAVCSCKHDYDLFYHKQFQITSDKNKSVILQFTADIILLIQSHASYKPSPEELWVTDVVLFLQSVLS